LPLWAALAIVAVRGGTGKHPLAVGDALVSANPYINALCLNPLYSVLRSALEGEGRQYRFFDEKHNVQVVRQLLDCGGPAPASERYPLLRESAGEARGNRKNVVLFLLESWSGKDLGCLGGDARAMPVFDRLAGEGLLFTNFHATGLRTPEGVFSILCSYPNQPLRPISNRPAMFQAHWRSLSQILAEAGYRNIFVHGRDLDFDNVRGLLAAMSFQPIIDRRDFPPAASTISDSWPGYSDEEVMRRADQEFAALGDRPFLGVIYTMNTHPPFVTPQGYPLLYEPRTMADSFLNALNYSDHTLGVFFELTRGRPYFKDTIFLFVADHSRTRDDFNYGNQHHIPFLIYAPGQVAPGRRSVVAGQLDILPTVLGLLGLKTRHAAWGRDLLAVPDDDGFAVSIAGDQVRWRTHERLLVDSPKAARPLLFHMAEDPECRQDVWLAQPTVGGDLRAALRAYMSLSQTLLYEDRIFPVSTEKLLP
jgi:phosphoglycerol transferase MdoB-like AlkP superfamily enzyme